MSLNHVVNNLKQARDAVDALIANASSCEAIAAAADKFVAAFETKGRVFSCGNGGSMCDAMHFAEELSGRFRDDRPGLAAVAISDPGYLSCVANDYGYEQVFARYIEAHAAPGDCLLAISTSGNSKNVIAAAQAANRMGVYVIGLTGKSGSPLKQHLDIEICTPGGDYADRVQELHIKVIHIFIELVERQLFPNNYFD